MGIHACAWSKVWQRWRKICARDRYTSICKLCLLSIKSKGFFIIDRASLVEAPAHTVRQCSHKLRPVPRNSSDAVAVQ